MPDQPIAESSPHRLGSADLFLGSVGVDGVKYVTRKASDDPLGISERAPS